MGDLVDLVRPAHPRHRGNRHSAAVGFPHFSSEHCLRAFDFNVCIMHLVLLWLDLQERSNAIRQTLLQGPPVNLQLEDGTSECFSQGCRTDAGMRDVLIIVVERGRATSHWLPRRHRPALIRPEFAIVLERRCSS